MSEQSYNRSLKDEKDLYIYFLRERDANIIGCTIIDGEYMHKETAKEQGLKCDHQKFLLKLNNEEKL